MKLVIQIPAWNEEENLPETIKELPKSVPGFDKVEVLVIDDGSTDRTAEVAEQLGAYVLRLPAHRGLAVAFSSGLDKALELGADVIVNTDADNQYFAGDIPKLVKPLIEGKADIVVGDRQVESIEHFSAIKKLLQKLGSWVVRKLSGLPVADATSGFRAMTREAAIRLNFFTRFTYTLEMLLQAGEAGLVVVSVPVRTNRGQRRPSRLFRSNLQYILKSVQAMARIVTLYNPLRIFIRMGLVPFTLGVALLLRFLWFYVTGLSPSGHVQSLIAAVILILVGSQIWVLGIVADLIAVNRRLLEEAVVTARKARYRGKQKKEK